ncbi:hypothetical protein PAHAL_1G117500 [Panicum hallii]|uniref:Uncharacterized protein n=1 Tax=Panicum hallii TaxID=206008 RepID=A0A2S3GNJ1_9POAL|nr:hypothetical protein PAHAL_1G117500 [Panicum hallii]
MATRPRALRRPLTRWHLCRQIPQAAHHGVSHRRRRRFPTHRIMETCRQPLLMAWRAARPCFDLAGRGASMRASNFTDLVPQISIHPAMIDAW